MRCKRRPFVRPAEICANTFLIASQIDVIDRIHAPLNPPCVRDPFPYEQ